MSAPGLRYNLNELTRLAHALTVLAVRAGTAAADESISTGPDGGIVVRSEGALRVRGDVRVRGRLVVHGSLEVGGDLTADSPSFGEASRLALRGFRAHRVEIPAGTRLDEVTIGGPLVGRFVPRSVRLEADGPVRRYESAAASSPPLASILPPAIAIGDPRVPGPARVHEAGAPSAPAPAAVPPPAMPRGPPAE